MKKFEEKDIFINKVKTHAQVRFFCYNGKIYINNTQEQSLKMNNFLQSSDDRENIPDNVLLTEDGLLLLSEDGTYLLLENDSIAPLQQQILAPVVTQDLILHLDASDPSSYSGTGTDWYDLSGNGNDAQIIGTLPFTTEFGGEFGDFSNGYAKISHNASLTPSSQITISTWAYMDPWAHSASLQSSIVSKTHAGAYALAVWQGKIQVWIAIGSSSYQGLSFVLPTGFSGWYNIAVSYDGSNIILYINGVSVYSITKTGQLYYSPSYNSDVMIGREPGASTQPQNIYPAFKGKVSTVMLYSRGLTSAEILQNFNAAKDRFGL